MRGSSRPAAGYVRFKSANFSMCNTPNPVEQCSTPDEMPPLSGDSDGRPLGFRKCRIANSGKESEARTVAQCSPLIIGEVHNNRNHQLDQGVVGHGGPGFALQSILRNDYICNSAIAMCNIESLTTTARWVTVAETNVRLLMYVARLSLRVTSTQASVVGGALYALSFFRFMLAIRAGAVSLACHQLTHHQTERTSSSCPGGKKTPSPGLCAVGADSKKPASFRSANTTRGNRTRPCSNHCKII